MKDILSTFSTLRRPRLLLQAARIGLQSYHREFDLRRQFAYGPLPRSGQALMSLMEIETVLNEQRVQGKVCYRPSNHVDVLIAVLGEAQILRASLNS